MEHFIISTGAEQYSLWMKKIFQSHVIIYGTLYIVTALLKCSSEMQELGNKNRNHNTGLYNSISICRNDLDQPNINFDQYFLPTKIKHPEVKNLFKKIPIILWNTKDTDYNEQYHTLRICNTAYRESDQKA